MDINYKDIGKVKEIMQWCEQNIPHTRISNSKRTGFNSLWGVEYGIYTTSPRVYIKDEKYAMFFMLRWS